MGSNRMSYNVDIVFCIDCTESMDNILNIVKKRATDFYHDVQNGMEEKGKAIDQLRVKVIAFRDYLAFEKEKEKNTFLNQPMLISDFFVLPKEDRKFDISVRSLKPSGGGDDPEDGLEALAYAIRSDWNTSGSKDRHVIVLWTDQPPHNIGFAKNTVSYPKGMAKDFDELTEWWGDKSEPGYMHEQSAKRLILFAPNEGAWKSISENWDNVIHYPSEAGNHLRDVDYQTILSCIFQTL